MIFRSFSACYLLRKTASNTDLTLLGAVCIVTLTFVWQRYFVCLCIAYKLTLGKTFTDTFSQRKIQ